MYPDGSTITLSCNRSKIVIGLSTLDTIVGPDTTSPGHTFLKHTKLQNM